MQQLHLVGYTADHEGLIFSTRKGTKSGGFVVTVDKKLLAKLEELENHREDGTSERPSRRASARPESGLSPREMQARLRAGRTVAQVAREAGVEEEWVERFAAPILAEQARIIEHARTLVFSKARLGQSAQPLGEAVRWNSYERGMRVPEDVFDTCWTAAHLRDGDWVVRFSYANRNKTQQAEWEVDLRDGGLTSRNRLATELGFVEPGRRLKRPPAVGDPTAAKVVGEPAPATASPAKRSRRTKKAGKRASTGRTTATPRKPTAKKPAAKKTAAKKTAGAKKAATAKKTAARKSAAAKKTTAKSPMTRKAARPAAKVSARKTGGASKRTTRKAAARATARPTNATMPSSLGTRAPSRLPPAPAARPRPISTPTPPRRETPTINAERARTRQAQAQRSDQHHGAIAAPPPLAGERRAIPVRPTPPRSRNGGDVVHDAVDDHLIAEEVIDEPEARPVIRFPRPSSADRRQRPLRAR